MNGKYDPWRVIGLSICLLCLAGWIALGYALYEMFS